MELESILGSMSLFGAALTMIVASTVPMTTSASSVVTNNIASPNDGTNANFLIYENTTFGIKIEYPQNWILKPGRIANPSLDIVAKFSPSSSTSSDFTIGIKKLAGDVTIDDYAKNTLNSI